MSQGITSYYACVVGSTLIFSGIYISLHTQIDLATYCVSFFGFLIGVSYLCYVLSETKREVVVGEKLVEEIINTLRACTPYTTESVLKDYEITNREIERRENITLVIGTILITSSFIILGNTATSSAPKFPYALASISLFVLWLTILYFTTKMLDDEGYYRVRAMEEAFTKYYNYEFGIHRYSYALTQHVGWIRIRRGFWGFILILLSIAWVLLSTQ